MRREVAGGAAARVLRAAARDLQRRGRADGEARARPAGDAGREHNVGDVRAARSLLHVHHDARRSRAAAAYAREVLALQY